MTTSQLMRMTMKTERAQTVKAVLLAACRAVGFECRDNELPDITLMQLCDLHRDTRGLW